MKSHTVRVQGLGDSCARSHHMVMNKADGEAAVDPELEFETELLAALEAETVTIGTK